MEILIAKDYEAVSEKAAKIISEHITRKKNSVLGLATGSTPLGLYAELVRMYRKGEINFSQIKTFNLDEYYGLEPSHSQSYAHFMHENFFRYVNIPPENVHIPNGTASKEKLKEYCQEYENEIKQAGGIDLQILGIGIDGHIGFNEPGSSQDSRTRLITLDESTIDTNWEKFYKNSCPSKEKMPHSAITMGISTILEAKKILLLASGKEKAEIAARFIKNGVTDNIPASFLKLHKNVIILLDKDAASKFRGNVKND